MPQIHTRIQSEVENMKYERFTKKNWNVLNINSEMFFTEE